eukprot:CAMPEP_0201541730 /NCGR_PEP_ID=MMETSP0161_2-20130828/71633_1 /ASSEMBLY_ACC=CAM_ASM_000251 /TAXON_ID=180227 /ORGANISM="Neoparamoeba aestuarina, Strain SoJaBio B1-5/56/2" /LENGTH=230 /DNA_ID=CAMNT_0047949287 /DNA_START=212 /DNA_END=901 /DNA_ORIENTATION=+
MTSSRSLKPEDSSLCLSPESTRRDKDREGGEGDGEGGEGGEALECVFSANVGNFVQDMGRYDVGGGEEGEEEEKRERIREKEKEKQREKEREREKRERKMTTPLGSFSFSHEEDRFRRNPEPKPHNFLNKTMVLSSLGDVGCGSFLAQCLLTAPISSLYNKNKTTLRGKIITIHSYKDTMWGVETSGKTSTLTIHKHKSESQFFDPLSPRGGEEKEEGKEDGKEGAKEGV